MLSEEAKRNPIYLEALGLMQSSKVEAVEKWQKGKLKQARKNYSRVSAGMFSAYETALNQYVAALKAAYSAYQSAGSARKESILEKLITKDRKNLANAIKTMDTYREENKPAPAQDSASKAGKKSNSFKRFLVWTGIAASLTGIGGYLWGNKNSQQYSAPREGDRTAPGMEQRVAMAPQTQSYVVPATHTGSNGSLLPRLQQSVDQSMADVHSPMDNTAFNANVQGRWQRNVISGLDVQGSANQAAIANNMAKTSAARRAINYNEQRMKVDTMESWEDVSRSIERTTGHLKGTIEQATGGVNAFRGFGRALRGDRK